MRLNVLTSRQSRVCVVVWSGLCVVAGSAYGQTAPAPVVMPDIGFSLVGLTGVIAVSTGVLLGAVLLLELSLAVMVFAFRQLMRWVMGEPEVGSFNVDRDGVIEAKYVPDAATEEKYRKRAAKRRRDKFEREWFSEREW